MSDDAFEEQLRATVAAIEKVAAMTGADGDPRLREALRGLEAAAAERGKAVEAEKRLHEHIFDRGTKQ